MQRSHHSSTTNRMGVAAVTAMLLLTAAATPAAAGVGDDGTEVSRGFALGTVVHAEAIEQPELGDPSSVRVVDADVAFSSAAHDDTGLPEQQTTEYGGLFQPAMTADGTTVTGANAYGRGFGLDVSVGQEGQQDGQLSLAGLSEAVAPPSTELIVNELGPVPGDPLAYATLLRGESQAVHGNGSVCPSLGGDISYGRGLAADAQLVDADGAPDGEEDAATLEQPVLRAGADGPERAVSSSLSHTFLAPQTDADGDPVGDDLAVVAETRQTIAPVTLFGGTDNAVTIEFLGEWVLRAVATGVPGSARVEYGPGEASPDTPLLRVLQSDSTMTILRTQDLFGDAGMVLDASPLVSLAIGEDPRAIGGDAESSPAVAPDGTAASAAVDVLRVRLGSAQDTGEVTELRVGHMEVSAVAPAGGISCDLPVSKTSDEDLVEPGDTFTYTITVDNPFQCPLTNVRILDELSASDDVTWTVDGTEPEAASVSDDEVVWEGLGPIEPGGSLSVSMTVTVGDDSEAGVFRNEATATATCAGGPVEARTDVTTAVDLDGGATIDVPEVEVPVDDSTDDPEDPPLATTGGGAASVLVGLLALGLGLAVRRGRS